MPAIKTHIHSYKHTLLLVEMKTQVSAQLARLDKKKFAQLLVQIYYTLLSQRIKGPVVRALNDLATTYLVCASRQREGEGLLNVHWIDSCSG